MQNNKLRTAIRSTAAIAILGVSAQATAVELDTGDYETNLYGFVRAVASYDFDENLASGGQAANIGNISPGDSNTADGHFGIDAKTSRVGLSVMSPQGVKAVVEYDFDRDDSLTPRLRLAYGEYNGVLIGQNWSNYNSFVGNTSSLDFDNVPGLAGTQGRAEQIRYTTGPFSVSIETPANSVSVGPDADGDPDLDETKDSTPAFTARIQDSQGGISYAAAVMAKQLEYDTGTEDDSTIAYAAFLAGKIAVTDMLSIQGAINYGEGAAAYVWRAGGNFGQYDGYVDPNGDVEAVEQIGGAIGASLALGGGRSINAGYGTASADLDDAVAEDQAVDATITDTNTMMFVNYQWKPVENVNMGVEYSYVETETQGGEDGDANRILFLAQYSF